MARKKGYQVRKGIVQSSERCVPEFATTKEPSPVATHTLPTELAFVFLRFQRHLIRPPRGGDGGGDGGGVVYFRVAVVGYVVGSCMS